MEGGETPGRAPTLRRIRPTCRVPPLRITYHASRSSLRERGDADRREEVGGRPLGHLVGDAVQLSPLGFRVDAARNVLVEEQNERQLILPTHDQRRRSIESPVVLVGIDRMAGAIR